MAVFFKEFNIIKILEYQAFEIWEEIGVSNEVTLSLNYENGYIEVRLANPKEGKENCIIGVLPQEESKIIKYFLAANWKDVFKCWICKKDDNLQYDQRLHILVHINENQKTSE